MQRLLKQRLAVEAPADLILLLHLHRSQFLARRTPGVLPAVGRVTAQEPGAAPAQLPEREGVVPVQWSVVRTLPVQWLPEPEHQEEQRLERKAAWAVFEPENRSGISGILLLLPVPGSWTDPLSPDVHKSDRL